MIKSFANNSIISLIIIDYSIKLNYGQGYNFFKKCNSRTINHETSIRFRNYVIQSKNANQTTIARKSISTVQNSRRASVRLICIRNNNFHTRPCRTANIDL